jgi:hypothetical protein
MTTILGITLIVAIIIFAIHRGLQMKNLAHRGVLIEAKVIKKFRKTSGRGAKSSPCLKYDFLAPTGQRIERTIAVAEGIYEQYEEGAKIDVVYLPDKPQVNGAKYMVNLSREALKLPPL